jgi:hypothetical protein
MQPTRPTHPQDGAPRSPEAAAFADVMRSVLHTRPDSPAHVPHALEMWNDVDGYLWQWSTGRGQWTVTAGAMLDPRAKASGPAGEWTCETYDRPAAEQLVAVLRLAGALPQPAQPADGGPRLQHNTRVFDAPPGPGNPHAVTMRPRTAVLGGERYGVPGPVPALRAVLYRPGVDPYPQVGPGCVPVGLFAGRVPEVQNVLLPGRTAAMYRPGRTAFVGAVIDGRTCVIELPADVPAGMLGDQPDLDQALAVQWAQREAAPPGEAPPVLGDEDPAIARARAAEAAAGVLPATLPPELQPAAKWGQPLAVPAEALTPEAQGAGRDRVLGEVGASAAAGTIGGGEWVGDIGAAYADRRPADPGRAVGTAPVPEGHVEDWRLHETEPRYVPGDRPQTYDPPPSAPADPGGGE